MTAKYNEFTVNYLEENPTGPYDLAKVSEIFTRQMDEAIKTNQDALNSVNSQMNNYTDKLNENKSNMLTLAYTANENDYVTEAEWTKVKNNMINYVMGMLLSGEIDNNFLLQLNSKYTTNKDYKEALSLINKLKNSNDPLEMQQLLTQAQNKISSFVTSIGKDKSVNCVNEYARSEGEKGINDILNTFVDKYLEEVITEKMSDTEKSD